MLSLSLVSTLGSLSGEASTLSVTPSSQNLYNAYDTASWTVSATGVKPLNLMFKYDSNATYDKINSQWTGASFTYRKSYDLGSLSYKYWYPTFTVTDYYGAQASKNVSIYHRRY